MASNRHCFCNLCKGNILLTKYKIKQHENIYGLWDPKEASEGPSTAKKSRIDDSDSSDSIENESEKQPRFGLEDTAIEGHDDFSTKSDSDGDDPASDYDTSASNEILQAYSRNIEEFIESSIPVVDTIDSSNDVSDSEDEYSTSGSESDEDSDDGIILNADIPEIMAATASGEPLHNVHEAIAESPVLHEGSTCTLFETLVQLFDWFSSHPSLSKEAFSRNLKLWHSILPKGNSLPTSYREAYQIIKPYLVPEVVFHVCPNDCIIFRGEYKNSSSCPKCNKSRFKAGKVNTPQRTFHYLPLGPRLARSFGTKDISYLLQSHEGECLSAETGGIMTDIHDSPKWKEAFDDNGTFHGDPRGVALSLCLDGLNPWSKNKATYSMWPIVLAQLNLPRRIRYQFANLLLVGIIPSQKEGSEPKDLDPYLEVLVDELISLCGCKIYDDYKKAPFNVKVEILIYVLDYQGLGKVFSLTGTGSYRGCAWCLLKGQYCKHLSKVVYPGNRRFLPLDHELRKDCEHFPAP